MTGARQDVLLWIRVATLIDFVLLWIRVAALIDFNCLSGPGDTTLIRNPRRTHQRSIPDPE